MLIYIAVEDNGTILHFSTRELRDEYVDLSGIIIAVRDIDTKQETNDEALLDYK